MEYDSHASAVLCMLNKFALHILGGNIELLLTYTLDKYLDFCIIRHNFHCIECKNTFPTFSRDEHKKPNFRWRFFLKN